jgi:hypothetical protein
MKVLQESTCCIDEIFGESVPKKIIICAALDCFVQNEIQRRSVQYLVRHR